MRRRLLVVVVSCLALASVLLGVPLGVLAWKSETRHEQDLLDRDAATVAARINDVASSPENDTDANLDGAALAALVPGRHVVVVNNHGTFTGGPAIHGESVSATVSVREGTVTVSDEEGDRRSSARAAVLVVLGLVLLAFVVGVALALVLARRLARPLLDLADRAERLGRGEFTLESEPSGIPEVDAVADRLTRSAAQVGATLTLQDQFASDAAHQLRSPLTALTLRMELLAIAPEPATRQEAQQALGQITRMVSALDDLRARARGDRTPPRRLLVDEAVQDAATAFQPLLAAEGRSLLVRGDRALTVLARPGHTHNVLTVLLENSLRHGAGQVTLDVTDAGAHVAVDVADDGPGIGPDALGQLFQRKVSTAEGGTGLALARALAEADGGQLLLADARHAHFRWTVPAS